MTGYLAITAPEVLLKRFPVSTWHSPHSEMSTEYHGNHYVPVWYQKRFIPSRQTDNELFYLELKPGSSTDARGVKHELSGIHRWGPKHCFRERDLYTTHFGSEAITEIERVFFGAIDQRGKRRVPRNEGAALPGARPKPRRHPEGVICNGQSAQRSWDLLP